MTAFDGNAALRGFLAGPGGAIPGRLLYAKVWGSHSHGTQLPTSDVDYLAVYQLPTRTVLGLDPWPDTVDGKGPDFESHELGKFAGLVLKGNPGIVEMLFTTQWQVTTPGWDALRERRGMTLNQATLGQYLGYCDSQLRRLQNGTRLHTTGGAYNTKWAYHLLRVAMNAELIARGEPPVVTETGERLAHLIQVRAGAFSPEEVVTLYQAIRARIDVERSRLPEAADRAFLGRWLWERRLEYLE
jgi:hypothetical protein